MAGLELLYVFFGQLLIGIAVYLKYWPSVPNQSESKEPKNEMDIVVSTVAGLLFLAIGVCGAVYW